MLPAPLPLATTDIITSTERSTPLVLCGSEEQGKRGWTL